MPINGKARIGFITNGAPNISGSLILNMLGIMEKRPTFFKYSDFENIINIHKLSVAPAPPIHTNHWKNGSTIICGNGSPAALASIFWSNKENQMGWNTAPMTATPCIPADHKSTKKNTGIKAPNKLSPAKLPNGSKILLIIAFKSIFNMTLTNQDITIITIAGTKDSKERATDPGTWSGILIVKPDFTTKRIISTANIIDIIATNNPDPPKSAIGNT